MKRLAIIVLSVTILIQIYGRNKDKEIYLIDRIRSEILIKGEQLKRFLTKRTYNGVIVEYANRIQVEAQRENDIVELIEQRVALEDSIGKYEFESTVDNRLAFKTFICSH